MALVGGAGKMLLCNISFLTEIFISISVRERCRENFQGAFSVCVSW